jgi:hypothetical protein
MIVRMLNACRTGCILALVTAACTSTGAVGPGVSPADGSVESVVQPEVYRPFIDGHGYREIKYPDGTLQVSFRGDAETGADEVEALLFRRMAELAQTRGEDRFIVLRGDVDCVTSIKVSPTTTCIVRQSADALFPYYFGDFVIGRDASDAPVSEYEATAFMRAEGPEDCRPDRNCFLVADVLEGRFKP